MKKILLAVGIVAILSTLSSCKGSKCDCPSFSPKKHRGYAPSLLQNNNVEVFKA